MQRLFRDCAVLRRALGVLALLACAAGGAGCGQKGDLYLPDPQHQLTQAAPAQML